MNTLQEKTALNSGNNILVEDGSQGISSGTPIDLGSSNRSKAGKKQEFIIPLNTILSGLALLISISALGWSLFHDPLGKGLKAYDLSTPKAALIAQLQMSKDQDFRAQLQMGLLVSEVKIKEKIRTLEVHKEAQWGGKVLLFVSFSENGVKKYWVDAVEKDAKSGLWMPSWVGSYDVGISNKALAGQMTSWEKDGTP